LCVAAEYGFEANVSGFHQVSFDPWEWRLGVTSRYDILQIEKSGGWYHTERRAATNIVANRKNDKCDMCKYQNICDKPPEQYQKKYGIDEITPALGEIINDPLYFQMHREFKETIGE
jgi:hypothetical protein